MDIPPPFRLTNHVVSLLSRIEANRLFLQATPLSPKVIMSLQRQSLLKSSVFSANIEGNPLTVVQMEAKRLDEDTAFHRQEIENILTTLAFLQNKGVPEVIDLPFLVKIHTFVMHKLVHKSLAGNIRNEPSAIFNREGQVVYMPPPPSEIIGMLNNLFHFINNDEQMLPPVHAFLTHLVFEKIHPFIDGNGRVGRLLIQAMLARKNYHFNWLLSLEELLNERKQTYYVLLDHNDANDFVEFLLEIFFEETEKLKEKTQKKSVLKDEDYLLPRRKELLQIIKEHTFVSFNQLQRRFLKIPARTIRYDLQQLEKNGFIRKIGTTRGSVYQEKKTI